MHRHRSGGLFVGGTALIGLLLIGGAQFASLSGVPAGLALDLVDGLIDFVEVLQFGQLGL